MKVTNLIDLAAEKEVRPYKLAVKATFSPTILSLALAAGILIGIGVIPAAFAAQGGNGDGGGNGGSGPEKGDLYGDAVYLLRNADTGVPEVINGCIRPLAAPDGGVLALNADYATNDYTPQTDSSTIDGWWDCEANEIEAASKSSSVELAAEDEDDDELEACDPISNCADYVTEADLGRLSILKSPERVLDRQLEEAITKLNSGEVSLDASGRPVVGGVTFDSPLLNLALYREFHLWGAIVEDPLGNNEEVIYEPNDFILAAAFGFGGGDDKEDPGIDNEIAVRTAAIINLGGLIHELFQNGDAVLPDSYEFNYEGKTSYFVNYTGFTYSRSDTFPGNICFDHMVVDGEGNQSYERVSGPIIDIVFEGDPDMNPVALALPGFSLAANDARRVLVFVHDNQVQFVDAVFEETEITLDNCPVLN